MRNFTKLTRLSYISFITLLTSLAWTNVNAGVVVISPDITRVELHDIFTVDIDAQGFTEAVDGWGMDVNWDTSVLALESSSVNTIWGFTHSDGDSSTVGNLLNIGGSKFGEEIGDFNLASLTFRAIGAGVTDIRLLITDDLLDAFRWSSGGFVALPNGTVNGTVDVSNVPLPAGVWLMLTGLSTLLVGTGRKQTVA